MTAERKRGWRLFALLNGTVLLAVLCGVPLLVRLAESSIAFCAVKKYLHLYCFTCGGTRATFSLFRFRFLTALRENAAVVWTYGALLFLDGRALWRLLHGNPAPFRISKWFWWGLLVLFLLYGVLRNVSLLCGWDWTGDFF